jgi:hypothetical protein
VTVPEDSERHGLLAELMRREARLIPRVLGVLRLDRAIYAEIEQDPAAIPQAFAVVIVTSLLAGIGQGSLAGIFLGVAGAICVWLAAGALIWATGTLIVGEDCNFARLLRCLGFAYAWFALQLLSELPFIGSIFAWGAVLLALISTVLATREALDISTELAVGITTGALATPLLLFWIFASCA